jgi:hypothetical protein
MGMQAGSGNFSFVFTPLFVTKLNTVSDRFCGIKYENANTTFLAYSVYLPTSGKDDEFLEVLSQLKYDIDQNKCNKSSIILGTDSNCSIKSTKRRYQAMQEFSLKTVLLNNEPTFHHNNGTSNSQIDHIYNYVRDDSIEISLSSHLCKIDESSNMSAHDLILGNLTFSNEYKSSKQEDFSSSYTDFEVKKPIYDPNNLHNYQNQISEILNDAFKVYNETEEIPILSEIVSKTLVTSAKMNFKVNNKKTSKKHTFSHELKAAYAKHKKVCDEWRKGGRPTNNSHPLKLAKIQSQKYLQFLRRSENTQKTHELNEKLKETHRDDMSSVCKKLKQIRGDKVQKVSESTMSCCAMKNSLMKWTTPVSSITRGVKTKEKFPDPACIPINHL